MIVDWRTSADAAEKANRFCETTDFRAALPAKSARRAVASRNADRSSRICFREETCFFTRETDPPRLCSFACWNFPLAPTTYAILFLFSGFFIRNIETANTVLKTLGSSSTRTVIKEKINHKAWCTAIYKCLQNGEVFVRPLNILS